MLITPEKIERLGHNEIFVFGSNLAGMHHGGAAKLAVQRFGAIMGQGVGLQGNSYAIPTMQGGVDSIQPYVDRFIDFAIQHPELTFYVTKIGCGIAGFKEEEIGPLFIKAIKVENIALPKSFADIINSIIEKEEDQLLATRSQEVVNLWRAAIQEDMKYYAQKIYEDVIQDPSCLGYGMGTFHPEDVSIVWPYYFHYYKFNSCADVFEHYFSLEAISASRTMQLGIKLASVGFSHRWCRDYGEYVFAKEIQNILEKRFNDPDVRRYTNAHPFNEDVGEPLMEL